MLELATRVASDDKKGLDMRTHRMAFALSIMAIASALFAGTASAARSIELRIGERVVKSAGQVKFSAVEEGGGLTAPSITCDVTLLKTLATRIPKVAGTIIGKVTGIAIDRGAVGDHCATAGFFGLIHEIKPLAGRGVGLHRELGNGVLLYDVSGGGAEEWNLIYDGFGGFLPEITAINYHISTSKILFEDTRESICLYEGAWHKQIQVVRRVARTLRISLARTTFRLTNEGLFCPRIISSSGELTLTPSITIALL